MLAVSAVEHLLSLLQPAMCCAGSVLESTKWLCERQERPERCPGNHLVILEFMYPSELPVHLAKL